MALLLQELLPNTTFFFKLLFVSVAEVVVNYTS